MVPALYRNVRSLLGNVHEQVAGRVVDSWAPAPGEALTAHLVAALSSGCQRCELFAAIPQPAGIAVDAIANAMGEWVR